MNTMTKEKNTKKNDSFKTDDMVLEGDGQSILINGRRFKRTGLIVQSVASQIKKSASRSSHRAQRNRC